jgi:hypothetical protein
MKTVLESKVAQRKRKSGKTKDQTNIDDWMVGGPEVRSTPTNLAPSIT